MELGGNSIAAVNASVSLEKEGFSVGVAQLLGNLTLKQIIQEVTNNEGNLGNMSVPACQLDKGNHYETVSCLIP